ncbi:hypothetical protein [Microbispora rosea]|uniref:hypothetical protein n=1 Tax=Microbispora rosea TaxID=58117 RepID=UPI0034456FF0
MTVASPAFGDYLMGDAESAEMSDVGSGAYTTTGKSLHGLVSGSAEVPDFVPPGVYGVLARCVSGGEPGRASFQVIPPKGGITPARGRAAVTRVIVRPAAREEVEQWYRLRSEEPEDDLHVKITVDHEWRLRVDDPDVALLQAGDAFTDPTSFVTRRLGEVDTQVGGPQPPVTFAPPMLRLDPKVNEVVVTASGFTYAPTSRFTGRSCRLTFFPPAPERAVSRPVTHVINVEAPGWTLTGITGAVPSAQDRESVRFDGTRIVRMVFHEEPPSSRYDTASYLAGDANGQIISDPDPDEELLDDPSGPLAGAESVLALLAYAMVLWTFIRSLGAAWWRRPYNLLLPVWIAASLSLALYGGREAFLGHLLLLGVAPVIVVFVTGRRIGPPPWPGSTVGFLSLAASLAGAVLTGSGLLIMAAPWWSFALPAIAVGLTIPRQLRPFSPIIAVVLLGMGLSLTVRAGQAGYAPGYVAVALLVLLDLTVILSAGLAVASGRWSARVTLWSAAVLGLLIGFGMLSVPQGLSPAFTDLTNGGPALLYEGLWLLFQVHLALLVALLVVRLRRLGGSPDAVFRSEALATMMLTLFLTQITLDIPAHLSIVIMWVAVLWLLSGPSARRAKVGEEITPEQHQTLVRALVRRRFARSSLTALLRQGRSRIAAGEMSMAAFDKQRRALLRASDNDDGPIDPDLALSTGAGQPPWVRAVAACGAGLVLSIPFTTARVIQTTSPDGLASVLSAAAITPLLCAIFGFFYPRVRGSQPLSKSLFLLLAAVVIALPQHVFAFIIASTADATEFAAPLPTPAETIIGALLSMGNLAVVCLGLGLFWEWRLLSLAAEPWGRIRSVRSARAIAAPLTAIVIATGTAVSTALVNTAIAPLPTVAKTAAPTQEP